MMRQLQNWFERLVGVVQAEAEMRRRAREIFAPRELPAEIHLPACWRRQPRVRQRRFA